MKTRVVAVSLLLFAGCARQEGNPVVAVQEAVFRYQFDHNASVAQHRASAYFLAFGDPYEKNAIDPPAKFLARFSGLKPRIALYSEAERSESGWVIDRKSKESGVIFFVHSIRMTGTDTAEAKGGLSRGQAQCVREYVSSEVWLAWTACCRCEHGLDIGK